MLPEEQVIEACNAFNHLLSLLATLSPRDDQGISLFLQIVAMTGIVVEKLEVT